MWALRKGLKLRKRVAKISGERSSLVDGKLASGGASLLLTIEDLKAVGSRFHMSGLVCGVDRQLDHIIKHHWHQFSHILVRCPQIRISINFDQPHPKIFINEKVKPK